MDISGLLPAKCKLKTQQGIDDAITTFTNSLKLAALRATPTSALLESSKASPDGLRMASPSNFLPSHIKKLVALKRKASSLWQTNHSPDSRRKFNQASNTLKQVLYKFRNAASIWRPI